MYEPAPFHPIARTRSMAWFLRGVLGWTVVLTFGQWLVMWWFVEAVRTDWKSVWPSLLVVPFMMLVSALRQIRATRKRGLSGVLDVRQSVTMTLTAPVSTVVESFRDALKASHATELDAVGDRHVEISATVRNCTIHFSCHPNPDGTIEIHIRSDPRVRLVLFDNGENLTTVKRLARAFWWREMRQRYAS